MLAKARALPHLAVPDIDQAKSFYTDTLGLPVSEEHEGMFMVDAAGTRVLVYGHPDARPGERTVFGWLVDDLDGVIAALTAKGVAMEQYDEIEQDERGVSATPEGGRIAWFKDPAGHILSVIEEP